MTQELYDDQTINRLRCQYSAERVYAIVTGSDAATNDDLAAWRSLGRGPGQLRPSKTIRLAIGRGLVKQGYSFEDAARMAEVGVVALKASYYRGPKR